MAVKDEGGGRGDNEGRREEGEKIDGKNRSGGERG